MYVHSVKLINFKSIGDYQETEIILEPRVTVIIGKNESGKSNVLDGLSHIWFTKKNPVAFSEDIVNRACLPGVENKYQIILKPSISDFSVGINEDTQIEISKQKYVATGGLYSFYLKSVYDDFKELVHALDEIGTNPFQLKDHELNSYKMHRNELEKVDYLDVPQKRGALNFLQERKNRLPISEREHIEALLKIAQDKWSQLLMRFPLFFYRQKNKSLNTIYRLEEVEKELKKTTANQESLLYAFLKVIEISDDEFILAVRAGATAKQESIRRKINKLVNEKINKPFLDFYKTEKVSLDLGFNSNMVSFVVQTENGEALLFSERSNGLRWYLETFIDLRANDIQGKNIVFLLDEPGVSLHVNAQKELLKLFGNLADKGNQIVYSTHSPYMLDLENDGVHRVRAVVKNKDGETKIYKTAYDSRIAPESQYDTLAPLISALGMNLNDTFGPAKGKINIVTEGMSDYIFLCTMAKNLKIDTDKYAIIPSVGATNCVNLCAILHGWGCKYIALFDFDKEGVEKGGEYMSNNMFFEINREYCYVKDIIRTEIESREYISNPYMIEDVMIRTEIERFCDENEVSKTLGKPLTAKMMCNAIESGAFILSESSVENFKKLFERIFTYCKENVSL